MQEGIKKNDKTPSSYFFESKDGKCLQLIPLVALSPFFDGIDGIPKDEMPSEISKMFTTLAVTCHLNGWNERNIKGNEILNKFLNKYTNQKDCVNKYRGGDIFEYEVGKLKFVLDPKHSEKQVKVLAINGVKNALLELVENKECANFYGRYDFWNRKEIALKNNAEDKATNYDTGNDFSVISLFDNKDDKDKVNSLIHFSCSGFDTYDMVGVTFNDYLTQFFKDAEVDKPEYEWLSYYKNYNISIEGKLTTALGNGHIEAWRRKLLKIGCIMSPDDLAYQFANQTERKNNSYKFKDYKIFLELLLSDESNKTFLQNALSNILNKNKELRKEYNEKQVHYNDLNKRFEMTMGNRQYDATPWLYYKCYKAIVSKMENPDSRKYDPFNMQDLSKFGGSKPKNKSFLDVTRNEEYFFINAYRNILHQTQYRDGDPKQGLEIAQNAYLYFENKSPVKHVIQFSTDEQEEIKKKIFSGDALRSFFDGAVAKKVLEQQEKCKKGDHIFISRFIEDIMKDQKEYFYSKTKLVSLLKMLKEHPVMKQQLSNLQDMKVGRYYSDDKDDSMRDFSSYNIDVLEFIVLKSLFEYFVFSPENSLAYSSFWFRLQENIDYFVYHKAHPESTDGKDAIQKKYREMSTELFDLNRKKKIAEEKAKLLKIDIDNKSLAEVEKKAEKIKSELSTTIIGSDPGSNLFKKISQDEAKTKVLKNRLLGYDEKVFDVIKPKIENFVAENGLLDYENGEDTKVVSGVDKIETQEHVKMFLDVIEETDEFTDFVIDVIFEKQQNESKEDYIKRIDGLMQIMKELDSKECDILEVMIDAKIISDNDVKDFKEVLKGNSLEKLFISAALKQCSDETPESYIKRLDDLMQRIQRLFKIRTQASTFIKKIESELENHIGNLDYDRFIECVNNVCQSQGQVAANNNLDDDLKSLIINTRRQFEMEMKQTNSGTSLLPNNLDATDVSDMARNQFYRNRSIMNMYQLTQDFMVAVFVLAKKCEPKEKRQIILNAYEVESLMNNNPSALLSKYNKNDPIDNLISCLFAGTHFEEEGQKEIYKKFVKQFVLVFHQTNSNIPHMTQREFLEPKEKGRKYKNGFLVNIGGNLSYCVPIQELEKLIGLKLQGNIKQLDWFDVENECGLELDRSEWTELSFEDIEKKIEAKKKGENLIISQLKEKTTDRNEIKIKPNIEKKIKAEISQLEGNNIEKTKKENDNKSKKLLSNGKTVEQDLHEQNVTHGATNSCTKKLLITLGIVVLIAGIASLGFSVEEWITYLMLGVGFLSTGSGLMFDEIKSILDKIISALYIILFRSDTQCVSENPSKNGNSVHDKISVLKNLPGSDSPKVINSEEKSQNHG